VRRRTGGRRRRWVVLWPAAAARRAFFIGGSGVGGVRLNERTLDRRFFLVLQGQSLHL